MGLVDPNQHPPKALSQIHAGSSKAKVPALTETAGSLAPTRVTIAMGHILPPNAPNQMPRPLSSPFGTRERPGDQNPPAINTESPSLSRGNIPPLSSSPLNEIVSPVLISNLLPFLKGYIPKEVSFLLDGFTNGFSLRFKGAPFSAQSANHPSANQNPSALAEIIQEELKTKRIAGPFDTPPFFPFVCSPLGLVPKREHGKFRMIHDLSFPKTSSVNDCIDPIDAAVTYETLDNVIGLVQKMGAGALIAKVDIESAFRIIPVKPEDRYLLGFTVQGQFYFDKCLPMGCRTSCAIFERFSRALQWIAKRNAFPGSRISSTILFL